MGRSTSRASIIGGGYEDDEDNTLSEELTDETLTDETLTDDALEDIDLDNISLNELNKLFSNGYILSTELRKDWVGRCFSDDPNIPKETRDFVKSKFSDIDASMNIYLQLPHLYHELMHIYGERYHQIVNVQNPNPFRSDYGIGRTDFKVSSDVANLLQGRTDFEISQIMYEVFELLPATKQTIILWRGIPMKNINQFRKAHGFISTSLDPEIAVGVVKSEEENCCVFRIKVLPGTKIVPILAFETDWPEMEILLSAKGDIVVEDVPSETFQDIQIIDATYVPPSTLGKRKRRVEWETPTSISKRKRHHNFGEVLN